MRDGPSATRQRGAVGAFDWILLSIAALCVGALVVLRLGVVGTFAAMYQDFGAPLPAITRIVLTPWATIMATAFVAVLSLTGVGVRASTGSRTGTALSLVAVVLGVTAIAACIYALYAPIFNVAGSIR